jgi:hypothetical protein
MPARNRSRVINRVTGLRGFAPAPFDKTMSVYPTEYSDVSDITGVGDCAPFNVNAKSTDGGIINKPYTGGFASWFNQYVADILRTKSSLGHLTISSRPNIYSVSTDAVNRTNPSRPVVDLPVDIFDFRPGLESIRDEGFRVARRFGRRETHLTPGSGWLNYQFAIAPLVGDIRKLLTVQNAVARRIAYINRLYDGTGIRRTVRHSSHSATATQSLSCQSSGTSINRTFYSNTKLEVTCHVRWKPTSRSGLRPPPAQIVAWANRAVRGLTVDFSTLWELCPWSWLIDWFADVGSYLSTTRNIIPARLMGVYPMYHTTTLHTCDGYSSGNVTMTPIRVTRYTKERLVGETGPTARLSFLTARQLSIAAALMSTRR